MATENYQETTITGTWQIASQETGLKAPGHVRPYFFGKGPALAKRRRTLARQAEYRVFLHAKRHLYIYVRLQGPAAAINPLQCAGGQYTHVQCAGNARQRLSVDRTAWRRPPLDCALQPDRLLRTVRHACESTRMDIPTTLNRDTSNSRNCQP